MMRYSLFHPADDVLVALLADDLAAEGRDRAASHVRACTKCQDTVRFLTRLDAATSVEVSPPPPAILARALADRAAGERRILPTADVERGTAVPAPRRRFAWAGLAASLLVAGWLAFVHPAEVAAIAADSVMRIAPAKPRTGDTIRVVYRPSRELFAGQRRLVLRARLRIPGDAMYASGILARVRPVGTLTRTPGGEYTGQFALPDSVVFATLVVEDSAAHTVDDRDGRLWEVLLHDAHGQPEFDALVQRANDNMGRSWEQAYATATRLTKLYPDRIDAWNLLAFFNRALFGDRGADSLATIHQGAMNRMMVAARNRHVSEDEMGSIFFATMVRIRGKSALAADSAEFSYWLERMKREYPRHAQLAQYYAFGFTKDEWKHPERMLDSLEHLYARFAPLSGVGRSVAGQGKQAAVRAGSDEQFRRWSERTIGSENRGDSTYWMALAMVTRPATRAEAMNSLRALLAAPVQAIAGGRELREDARTYRRRADDSRRTILAALGRALIAEGRTREGVDTLGLASRGTWNPALFRNLREAYVAAGDSGGAQAMEVRIAVDPRTGSDSAAAIAARGAARFGQGAWDSLTRAASREMREHLLARSTVRPLRGSPALVTADGRSHTLREVMAKQPAAVVFWSRHCGAAVEALPGITRLTERLAREGGHLLLVIDEPPSADLMKYLAARQWTSGAYYDTRGEMRNAFNNFGTPGYYVVDAAGRIRFDGVDDNAEIVAQLDALRAERP